MATFHSEIINRVTMREVAERYGFKIDRQNRIICPFHNDKNPSLKIYEGNRGWYCFACGQGGNVINFVAKLLNLEYRESAEQIDRDFGLGLTDAKRDKKTVQAYYRAKMREKQELTDYRAEYQSKCTEYRQLFLMDKPTDDKSAVKYAKRSARIEYLDYWFLENCWR